LIISPSLLAKLFSFFGFHLGSHPLSGVGDNGMQKNVRMTEGPWLRATKRGRDEQIRDIIWGELSISEGRFQLSAPRYIIMVEEEGDGELTGSLMGQKAGSTDT